MPSNITTASSARPRRRPCCAWSRRTATATALCRSQTDLQSMGAPYFAVADRAGGVELQRKRASKSRSLSSATSTPRIWTLLRNTASPAPVYDEETRPSCCRRRPSARAATSLCTTSSTARMTRIGFRRGSARRPFAAFSSVRKAGPQERGHLYALRGSGCARRARNTPRCSTTASAAYARVCGERP